MASTSRRSIWVVFTWVVVLCGPLVEGTSTTISTLSTSRSVPVTQSKLPTSPTEATTAQSTPPTEATTAQSTPATEATTAQSTPATEATTAQSTPPTEATTAQSTPPTEATTAQSTPPTEATTAQSTPATEATTAQSTPPTEATTAQSTPPTEATTAQSTPRTSPTEATTAQSTPRTSPTEATTAQSTPATSQTEATTAQSTPATSQTEPTTAQSTPPTSPTEAMTAQSTPPTSPAEPTTTKPPDCQNGGYPNGTKCICLTGFRGDLCELFSDNVKPDVVNTKVIVEMVVDQEYKASYDDNNSPEYKDFVKNFTEQMTSYYKKKDKFNFTGVIVTKVSRAVSFVRRLRSNGVNVMHDIVLSVPNNADLVKNYGDIVDKINNAVVTLENCTEGCPDFKITNTNVSKQENVGKDICADIIPDQALREYYEALDASGWSCVSMCNEKHSNSKSCLNNGVCNVYIGIGPTCLCANINDTWYLRDDCSFPIDKIGFYAGLPTTLLVLLLILGALSWYLYFNKQRQNRKREVQESLVKEWLEEDVVWPNSRGHIPAPSATYSNPSFSADPTSRQGHYLIQTPPRGTAASSTGAFNSGQNQHQLQPISINQPIQIRRPQIRVGGAEPVAGPTRHLESMYRSPVERGNVFNNWDERRDGHLMYDA